MTNEEAIAVFEEFKVIDDWTAVHLPQMEDAVDMAIEALKDVQNCVHCEHYTERETDTGIKGVCKMDTAHKVSEIPTGSDKQVTGKLNKCDDSLLTADTETCKEQKSKLDLISRQDAIALVDRPVVPTGDGDYDNARDWERESIKNDLLSLPSAQTEKPKIIMCKDCKYYKAKQNGLPWNNSRRYCNRSVTLATNPDDFCSYGERTEK